MRTPKENLAIAAMICGVLGIVGGSIPIVGNFTFVLSVLGIVFGAISKNHVSGNYHTLALSGIITGIIGIALTVLVFVLVFVIFGGTLAVLGSVFNIIEEMSYVTAMLF